MRGRKGFVERENARLRRETGPFSRQGRESQQAILDRGRPRHAAHGVCDLGLFLVARIVIHVLPGRYRIDSGLLRMQVLTKMGIGGTRQVIALELYRQQSGYATPKVDVCGIVLDGDGILPVRKQQTAYGRRPVDWGGPNESSRQAVVPGNLRGSRTGDRATATARRLRPHGPGPPAALPVPRLQALHAMPRHQRRAAAESRHPGCGPFHAHDLPPLSRGRINERQIVRFVTMIQNGIRWLTSINEPLGVVLKIASPAPQTDPYNQAAIHPDRRH